MNTKQQEKAIRKTLGGHQNIPIHKIHTSEPSNALETVTKPGREITEPVDIIRNRHPKSIKQHGEYVIMDGHHRLQQAKINKQTHIKARVKDVHDWIDDNGNQHFVTPIK